MPKNKKQIKSSSRLRYKGGNIFRKGWKHFVSLIEDEGVHPEKAAETVAQVMKYGKVPSKQRRKEILGDPQRIANPFFLLLLLKYISATKSKVFSSEDITAVIGFAWVYVGKTQVDDPLALTLILEVNNLVPLSSLRNSNKPNSQSLLIDIRMRLGMCLVNSPYLSDRDWGNGILQELVSVSERMLDDTYDPNLSGLLGQILHNLAEAMKDESSGDRTSNLQKAVEYFRKANSIQERINSPNQFWMTQSSLASAYKYLADNCTDDEDRHLYYLNAIDIHEESLAEYYRKQPMSIERIEKELNFSNAKREYIHFLHQRGEVTEEEKEERLKLLADRILPLLKKHPRRHTSGVAQNIQVYEQLANLETAVDPRTGLDSLLMRIAGNGILGRTDAGHLSSALMSIRENPSEALPSLRTCLQHINLLDTGLKETKVVLIQEWMFLKRHLKNIGDEALSTYLSKRLADLESQLVDVRLPNVYRLLISRQMNFLSILDPARNKRVVSAEKFLELAEMSGAACYRSDMGFYGQGEVKTYSEAVWRMNLYRTRVTLEKWADHHFHELALDVNDPILSSIQKLPIESFNYNFNPDGNITQEQNKNPTEEMFREAALLGDLFKEGQEKGFLPSGNLKIPRLDLEELINWLEKNSRTGILTIGGYNNENRNATISLFLLDGHEIREIPVFGESNDQNDQLLEALDRLMDVRSRIDFESVQNIETGSIISPDHFSGLEDDLLKYMPKLRSLGISESALEEFNDLLNQLLSDLLPIGEKLHKITEENDIHSLVLLDRKGVRELPLEAIPISTGLETLSEVIAIIRLNTLSARLSTNSDDNSTDVLYIGTPKDHDSILHLAGPLLSRDTSRVAHCAKDGMDTEAARIELESQFSQARNLKIFAHGKYYNFPDSASGIMLDDRKLAEPIIFPWGISEIRCADLTRCARVELWACDSAHYFDPLSYSLDFDEPRGIATAFLVAGAKRVIGSSWKQHPISAILIADAFNRFAENSHSATEDARALGKAIFWYRDLMTAKGIFESTLREFAQNAISGGFNGDEVKRRSIVGALIASHQRLDPDVPHIRYEDFSIVSFDQVMLGPVKRKNQGREDAWIKQPDAAIDKLMDVLRAPWTWAGWRVLASDLSAIAN